MILNGFDFYIRQAVENEKVIFPSEFCRTDAEMFEAEKQGIYKKSLESAYRSLGPFQYGGQFLNDPTDDMLIEFKRVWIQTYDFTPETIKRISKGMTIMSIDPAFRLSQSNDFNGIAVSTQTEEGLVYVKEAKRLRANPKELMDEIFKLAEIYNPYKILVEAVVAQILLIDLLKEEMSKRNQWFVVEEVRPVSNEVKTMRIRGLIPLYANRRIFHSEGLTDLEQELFEFPRGTHDDILDALSYQVPFWKGGKTQPQMEMSKNEKDYWTLNWWKKKIPNRITVMGRMFEDMIPRPRMPNA